MVNKSVAWWVWVDRSAPRLRAAGHWDPFQWYGKSHRLPGSQNPPMRSKSEWPTQMEGCLQAALGSGISDLWHSIFLLRGCNQTDSSVRKAGKKKVQRYRQKPFISLISSLSGHLNLETEKGSCSYCLKKKRQHVTALHSECRGPRQRAHCATSTEGYNDGSTWPSGGRHSTCCPNRFLSFTVKTGLNKIQFKHLHILNAILLL